MKKTRKWMISVLLLIFVYSSMAAVSPPASADSLHEQETIRAALKDYYSLPKKERRARIREAKRIWSEHKTKINTPDSPGEEIVFLAILAVLLPPLAIVLKEKKITRRFWIGLLLTLLFLLPGIVYALLIVFGVI